MSADRFALDAARAKLGEYLRSQLGLDTTKNMHCLFHHPDNHPSMSLLPDGQAVYCHACHTTADIVDVISRVEGLPFRSKAAIDRAIEWAGTGYLSPAPQRPAPPPPPVDPSEDKLTAVRKYILACRQQFDHPDCLVFFRRRGFEEGDFDVLRNYCIGYDPQKHVVVIPHGAKYYTARAVGNVDKQNRFRHNAPTPVQFFNSELACRSTVFAITEGAIDALSLIVCGLQTLGLGGANNQKKLIERLLKIKHPVAVVLALDHDPSGERASEELSKKLASISVPYIRLPFDGHDVNYAFVANRSALATTIATTIDFAKKFAAVPSEPPPPEPPRSEPPPPSRVNIDTSDYGIAKSIMAVLGNELAYNFDSGCFMTYMAPIWRQINKDAELRFIVERFVEQLGVDEAVIRDNLSSEKKMPKVISAFRRFRDLIVSAEDFNRHPMAINCKNGIVDLETGRLLPHEPSQLWTKVANVHFDPAARSDIWNNFITSILPDEATRASLQTFFGYCLTGSIEEEKALFVHGSGANGKGTLFRTLLNLMGDFATPMRIDAVLAGGRNDAHSATPEFNKLEYARLVIAEEVPDRRKLDVSQFKLLTGGDPLPIRRLYCESTYIREPSHKMVFSGNVLPKVSDPRDKGFLRRLLVVKFPCEFLDANSDPKLKYKLAQPEVLSAVFNWLLEGCQRWQAEGFKSSEKMIEERTRYLNENDELAMFIEEFCELGKNFSVSRKNLLRAIRDKHLLSDMSDQQVAKRIAALDGIEYSRGKRGYVFNGIRLFSGEPDDVDIPPDCPY